MRYESACRRIRADRAVQAKGRLQPSVRTRPACVRTAGTHEHSCDPEGFRESRLEHPYSCGPNERLCARFVSARLDLPSFAKEDTESPRLRGRPAATMSTASD